MRIYFLSERTCALTVNGIFFGNVDTFERSANVSLGDGITLTFTPVEEFLPHSVLFTEETLFSPPEWLSIYRSGEEIALFAHSFLRADQSLHVLNQTRVGDTLFTLYVQGKLFLNVENASGFHVLPLPERLRDGTPRAYGNGFLWKSNEGFALLSQEGEILLSSEGKILSAQDTIKAEVPFHDSLGHVATCEWKGSELVSCTVRTDREPTEATFALALFESVLIGADATPYLHPSLVEKAFSLKEFLGAFTSVVLTDRPDRIGLVYPVRERVYDVRYYVVTVSEGKICNIHPEE